MKPTIYKKGFSLVEMLVVMALIGIASLVSARLFTSSMRVIHSAPDAQDYFASIDRMSTKMRQDVWDASAIEASDPASVLLRGNAQDIRWTFLTDAIVRDQGTDEQRWPIESQLTITAHGPTVNITDDNGNVISFVSQIIFAREAR